MTTGTVSTPARASLQAVRRLAVFWGLAGAAATIAVLPYMFALNPTLSARIHVALPVFVLAQFVQGLVLLTLLSWAGLRLGQAVGLASPIARAVVTRSACRLPAKTLAAAAMTGGAVGAALMLLDRVFKPFMPATVLPAPPSIDLAKRCLACFYGGISEELLCRLFLMTLLVWICWRPTSNKASPPRTWMIWTGIVGAALLFGLGHLPATAMVWPLTTLVVARALLLNAIAGIVFGWFYYRRGLEHAMLAHFAADLVLHVIGGS